MAGGQGPEEVTEQITVNQMIISSLRDYGLPVAPELYTGSERVYYTFNYDLVPGQIADNRPLWYRALIQIHLCCPVGFNSIKLRRDTINALVEGGFSCPTMIDVSDKDIQHFVFETEITTD